MNALIKVRNSSTTSFTLSLGLHLAFMVVFAAVTQKKHVISIKIPQGNSILLGDFKKDSSVRLPKRFVYNDKTQDSISTQASSLASIGSVLGSNLGSTEGEPEVESEDEILTAKQKYFLEFKHIIESQKKYPAIARWRGMEGVVLVAVTIKSNGEVVNHRIVKESGYNSLDEATLSLVKKVITFKSFPAIFREAEVEFKFPVAYKLNE